MPPPRNREALPQFPASLQAQEVGAQPRPAEGGVGEAALSRPLVRLPEEVWHGGSSLGTPTAAPPAPQPSWLQFGAGSGLRFLLGHGREPRAACARQRSPLSCGGHTGWTQSYPPQSRPQPMPLPDSSFPEEPAAPGVGGGGGGGRQRPPTGPGLAHAMPSSLPEVSILLGLALSCWGHRGPGH